MKPISITAIESVSPLGSGREEVLEAYRNPGHKLVYDMGKWMGRLPGRLEDEIRYLRDSDAHYRNLDRSVLLSLLAGRKVHAASGWENSTDFGINVGSSRGATALFESYVGEYLDTGRVATQASPATTLGNISSWLAHDLGSKGPEISHSITCSTALHAVLNGMAWLRSGMSERFLVGGAEAPLTPFTLAQMKALNIYSKAGPEASYPCRALDLQKSGNTMVLGEGAVLACLEDGTPENARAVIAGAGYATEKLEHSVSLSANGSCFQRAMTMALQGRAASQVDAIILHAPGTKKGDSSELRAIQAVFPGKVPALATNKWKTGHTFGASGLLSLEMAVLMMEEQQWFPQPFEPQGNPPTQLNTILVNAVGFGGNAVSMLLQRPGFNH